MEKFGWQPIDTAPVGKDVVLMVPDGQGEPYAVLKPFKLTAAGWVSSGKGTPLAVTPLQWRLYVARPKKR
ncbi:MAG TPA: hypothetical protein VKE98_06790 [Gemmataceae bacterium]|nr:hypothetical protein [Gemmataceae bacterium]